MFLVGAVVLAMLAGLLLFTVWLAGLSNKKTRCFDIYFAQAVGGLNKGSNVSFAGVPVGTVDKISLLPNRPEFVWVRIKVDQQTPVLQGTTAVSLPAERELAASAAATRWLNLASCCQKGREPLSTPIRIPVIGCPLQLPRLPAMPACTSASTCETQMVSDPRFLITSAALTASAAR